jgi:hypothetical protein
MGERHSKKRQASPKRIVLTFTDSPLDQALYAALKKTAESDDTTLCPYLIKFYLRNVCGMQPPDYRMLKRMGLTDDEALIYSKTPDNPFRKALENQLQIKNWLKALKEMGVLEARILTRIKATIRKAKQQAA